jgi:hypothetical protein
MCGFPLGFSAISALPLAEEETPVVAATGDGLVWLLRRRRKLRGCC